MKDALDIIVGVIAVAAFLISVGQLLYPYLIRLRLKLIPERQVQLIQQGNAVGINVLNTVVVTGPSRRCLTVKFTSGTLAVPGGRSIAMKCMTYLVDQGKGQQHSSRNIPVMLRGGDATVITPGLQSDTMGAWTLGAYNLTLMAERDDGTLISSPPIRFALEQSDLNVLAKPQATLMKGTT